MDGPKSGRVSRSCSQYAGDKTTTFRQGITFNIYICQYVFLCVSGEFPQKELKAYKSNKQQGDKAKGRVLLKS